MKKVAICVGHNSSAQGAMGSLGISEYVLNSAIANILEQRFRDTGVKVKVFHRLPIQSYTKQMKDLAKRVNKFNPDLAIELHFNAGMSKPKGHEVLYYHDSYNGKKYATQLDSYFDMLLPNKDRGIKGIGVGDRGSQFLRRMRAPALIAEPFFANEQGTIVNEHFNDLVQAYEEFIKGI